MHLAITMTCMVNSTAVSLLEEEIYYPEHFNSSSNYNLIEQGTLIWSHQMQNFIFSGTFWGALLVVGPSTLVYHRCSPRLLLIAAVGLYIVSTVVTPLLAKRTGPTSVFMARVFMGFGEGFVIPSINALIANWFPVEEKSTVLALYTTGNQFAGAVGNPIAAAFCASSFGWPAVFYFIAIVATIWCVLWIFSSSDQPRKCKWMTVREREYLTEKVVHRSNRANKATSVPYAKMVTSPAFLAQLLCFFITNVTMTLFHFYVPSFLKDVLYLGVIANGTFSALPNVINFVCKIFWSMLMDKLKVKKVITPTFAVRLSQSVASFGCAGSFLLIALLVDCTQTVLALVLFCIMYGTMSGFTSGFYTSLLSLAPRYTGAMSALSLFAGMLGRLVTPVIVGFVKKTGSLSEWRILFCMVATLNIVAGIIFLIFGSGEVQEWGKDDVKEERKKSVEGGDIALIEDKRTDSLCL
ncbi:hypothetical protein NECAME_00514 [Necator americanus]|uniref:Major facilitator superfamily (MFS) profile domain-containing protein n=1 Tax=Necator americanus TaxID=51031 RepID=W2T505_NECAM|nr:hypothetical protein NECAME_00514 [Necator americanus]ETN76988.1 hypothetical protein NECAME_00514 [Necator americanus]